MKRAITARLQVMVVSSQHLKNSSSTHQLLVLQGLTSYNGSFYAGTSSKVRMEKRTHAVRALSFLCNLTACLLTKKSIESSCTSNTTLTVIHPVTCTGITDGQVASSSSSWQARILNEKGDDTRTSQVVQ